jgi:predicted DNA-binding transcriptional regulator YafY
VTLLLEPAARWIIDVHHASEDSAARTDGLTLVEVPMHSADWAVRLVLSLRGTATVIAPQDVVDAVGSAADAALAAYPSSVR